jgi:hypothetical protein
MIAAAAMKRILLRSPKQPWEAVAPGDVLRRNLIGGNAGNLVFIQAGHRLLSVDDVEVTPDRFRLDARRADEINERHDVYVIPLANAFRPSFRWHLERMTALIERLRIPVVILGVGAQASVDYKLDRLKPLEPLVRRFMRAVLDRSPSVGVRGELSESYLRGLGFADVEVIGCPSMFLHGDALRVEKRVPELTSESRLAMNVSPYLRRMGPVVQRHVERYPHLEYVAQDLDTLRILLLGESAGDAATQSPLPVHLSHQLFRERRVRCYVDPWPWIDDLRGFEFTFGSRIHGNIAALIAGTPAYVLAHDSRTLELARYFDIPHRPLREVSRQTDAAALYAEADYSELNRRLAGRFTTFADYLHRHGLRHVFEEGQGPERFDAAVAAANLPPAVRLADIDFDGMRAAIERLRYQVSQPAQWRWLRRSSTLRTRLGR